MIYFINIDNRLFGYCLTLEAKFFVPNNFFILNINKSVLIHNHIFQRHIKMSDKHSVNIKDLNKLKIINFNYKINSMA